MQTHGYIPKKGSAEYKALKAKSKSKPKAKKGGKRKQRGGRLPISDAGARQIDKAMSTFRRNYSGGSKFGMDQTRFGRPIGINPDPIIRHI